MLNTSEELMLAANREEGELIDVKKCNTLSYVEKSI